MNFYRFVTLRWCSLNFYVSTTSTGIKKKPKNKSRIYGEKNLWIYSDIFKTNGEALFFFFFLNKMSHFYERESPNQDFNKKEERNSPFSRLFLFFIIPVSFYITIWEFFLPYVCDHKWPWRRILRSSFFFFFWFPKKRWKKIVYNTILKTNNLRKWFIKNYCKRKKKHKIFIQLSKCKKKKKMLLENLHVPFFSSS